MLETKRRNEDHELGRFWLSVLQGLESGKPAGSTEGSNCCGTANGISDAPCTATENKHNRARNATAHPRSPVMLFANGVYARLALTAAFQTSMRKAGAGMTIIICAALSGRVTHYGIPNGSFPPARDLQTIIHTVACTHNR